jgi:4-hydroxybenzoate polyprenyltransferase
MVQNPIALGGADRLPDAAVDNWVDRWAPDRLRPWLKLGRFDRPIGGWLLLLPGWQGVALAGAERGRAPDWRLMVLIFVGAFVMRAAGCAYNDIVDRDIDAKVARTAGRPIPSGQVSVRQAWAYVAAMCLIGLLVLLSMDVLAVALGAASLLLVAAYPFMKRVTWWPQAWLGLTFNWGALLGYAAATGGMTLVAWLAARSGHTGAGNPAFSPGVLSAGAVLLYLSGIFWTLGYDTIYAVQDMEDDALVGVKSSARSLGRRAPSAVLLFYSLAIAFALAAAVAAGLGPLFMPLAALLAIHFIWQAASLRLDDPQGALKLFKSNREAGLILLFAIVAGLWGQGGGLMGGL